MSTRYKQTIEWKDYGGVTHTVEGEWHDTPEGAYQTAMEDAVRYGYTRRKWWQWWRWGESKYPPWTNVTS